MASKWVHRLSNINREAKTADCASCGEGVRIVIRFRKSKGKEEIRCWSAHHVNKYYPNISVADIPKRHPCEICGDPVVVLDHCHDTQAFRGWLCARCNWAIGHLRNDPELAERAAEYLRKVLA